MQTVRRGNRIALTAVAMALLAAPLSSQPPAEGKWLLDRSLTVSPMRPPTPVFAYRLLPLASELRDGNAVPIYLRLDHEQNDASRKLWTEAPLPWNQGPIDQVPLGEAREFLKRFAHFFRQFDLGARRKTADWNYTLDQGTVVDLLIPDAQSMRGYVPMMVLRAKVQLIDGDFAGAAHALATGFAFSRHVAEAPLLISGLVGIACANQFADCVLDFVERPGAPNLYWALTALPRPLIDLRRAMEFEQRFFEMEFPDIRDIDRPRSPAQWDAMLKQLRLKVKQLQSTMVDDKTSAPAPQPGTGPDDPALRSPELPAAKRYLAERRGMSTAEIDAMPPAQVLLLYMVGVYRDIRDEQFTAVYLPYPVARTVWAATTERLNAMPDTEATRLARLWMPAIGKVQLAQSRLDRKIAALRVIEALRMHAAANGGQLPDSLDQIKVAPVPPDPGTGQPFEYRKEGAKATIVSRIPGESDDKAGLRYTVTLRK